MEEGGGGAASHGGGGWGRGLLAMEEGAGGEGY